MREIEYQIPRLGNLTATLYPAADIAYRVLESGQHLTRMKANPQLGVIRNVYEGAHHTRWEYVVTQLFLIDLLKKEPSVSGLGLSNNEPRIRGLEVSGADILQVWVLLLNAGHLYGTFATERALLIRLKKDRKLARIFLSGLPHDDDVKSFFEETLHLEDAYRVHELISFFLLERLKRRFKKNIQLLVDILKQFKFDPKAGVERRRRLKLLFRRIRQVSYLFLDSQYGPVPISFELGTTLFDFKEHAKELFSSTESPLVRALDSFNDLLSENFYLAPASMDAYGFFSRHIADKIIVPKGSNLYSIKGIYDMLIGLAPTSISYHKPKPENLLRLLIDERGSRFPILHLFRILELEQQWNAHLPKSRCQSTFEYDPSRRMLSIILSFATDITIRNMSRLLSQITQRFMAFQDDYFQAKRIGGFRRYRLVTFEASCRYLLLFIMDKLMGKEVSFTPNPNSVIQDHWGMYRGSTTASRHLNTYAQRFKIRGVDPDRLQEIESLSTALRGINHRGTVLLTTSQIIVRNRENDTHITDLDGIALCTDTSELTIVIVESKKTRRSRHSRAVRSLIRTLEAIQLPLRDQPEIKILHGYGAYCKVTFFPAEYAN
jgi:hypothetical protein